MFHIVLAIASRFLYFGNALQGFARGILALRNLGVISSHLIPAISPPPPIALLDDPVHVPIVGLPEEIIPPYPSAGLIALERIGRQPPPFASPIPSYQSSLITVSSSQLPIFLSLFIIMLAIISGFVIVLPEIIDCFMNVAKSRNITKFVRSAGHLLQWVIGPIIAILQWCGLLAAQDTRTPLINAIYEQITRGAAGYDDLVDCGDITYDHVEGQVVADGLLRNPDLAHDEIPEEYRLRLQKIYNQFVDSQNFFREQLDRSRAQQQELHTDLLAAERERERLESKRQGAKARCAEAEVIVSKLRADLSAAMEHLDRQTGVVSSKDDIIQSVTEKSQVAHVRLKYAEDKITHLNAKLQSERDRRHRKTKELLDEQARAQDRHESEIRRLKQEAQDAQEQLDSLRSKMSELHADGRSPLDHDHSALYRDHWVALEKLFTWMRQGECDTSQPPLPPEHIYDTDGPPISPAANVDSESSPLSTKRDHWVALEELFGWMRQEEYESAQDAVKPNEEQESQSRLQDELAATKEQLCLVEEEYLSVRCDIDQSREALREVKSHVVSLQFEWEMCKALVREAQEARRSSLTELAEVIELLRVSQAEWEESQFRCSQVTFLCGALQERVTELEAETKKGLKKCPAITPGHTNSEYRSCCPRYGTAPSDVEAITHEHELNLQESDSIDMIVPPLQPWIFDFSLPASPSPSSLYLNPQRSAISPTPSDIHSHSFCLSDTDIHSIIYNSDSFLIELSLAVRSCDSNSSHHYEVGLGNEQDVQQSTELGRSAVDPDFTYLGHLPPPSSPSSAGVSRLLSPIYRTFLSERNSLGSMDWPPIGSALSPGSGNVRQDREEDVGFEDGTDDPILSYQESLSPFQEPDPMDRRDPKPQISSIITPSSPPIQNFSHREVIYPLRQDRYSVTKTSPTSSSNRQDVPIRPPHHSLPPLRNLPPPPLLELQDSVSIDSVSDGSVQLRKGRRRASHRRGFSHLHGIPVPKLDYDLPADFVPPSFRRIAPTRQMDDFAFLIPLDCHTSTPAAARRRTRTGQTHS